MALLLYVSAREQQQTRPGAIEPAISSSGTTADKATRGTGRADSGTTPSLGTPEVQPPAGEIWLLGRIKYTPSNACEYVATLDALKADVQMEPIRAEGGAMHWLRESADLPAGGEFKLAVQIPKEPPDDPEMSPRVMLDPGRRFRLRVRSHIQELYGDVEFDLAPKVRGRVLDFGEISVGLSQFLGKRYWMLTGRLIAPDGTPLAHLERLSLFSRDLYMSGNNGLRTDANGRFVLRTSYDDEYAALVAQARWDLDIAGTGYIHEDTWRFSDGLIQLPVPEILEAERTISFGDAKIECAFIEVSFLLSGEAQEASSGETLLSCSLDLESGYQRYSLDLRTDRVALIPALPGLYSISATFGDDRIPKGLGVGPPVKIIPQDVLPHRWRENVWAALEDVLELKPGERRKLVLEVMRANEVLIVVDTPAGRAKKADFKLEFGPDTLAWVAAEELLNAAQLRVRMRQGFRGWVNARVDGFAPVRAALPSNGELVLRVGEPAPDATVDISWAEEDRPVQLVFRASNGDYELHDKLSGNSRTPARIRLAPGSYLLEVFPVRGYALPGEMLCDPIALELKAGEHRFVNLSPLKPTQYEEGLRCKAYAGRTQVEGMASAIDLNLKAEFIGDFGHSGSEYNAPGVFDGGIVHAPKLEEIDGKPQLSLRLPVRITVTVPEAVAKSLGSNDWRIECRFGKHGYCRSTEPGAFVELWAPPGPCTVTVQSNKKVWLDYEWAVEVKADAVIELALPGGMGVVNFDFEKRSLTPEQYRERVEVPRWLLIRVDGAQERILDTLSFGSARLLAGDYVLRAAFGADSARRIEFSVADGQEITVRVPFPDSPVCNGRALISLPDWSGEWDVEFHWRPTAFGDDWFFRAQPGDGPVIRYRILEGRLYVEGLPRSEPLVLSIEFSTRVAGKWRTLQARIENVTFEGTEPKPLDAAWVEQK